MSIRSTIVHEKIEYSVYNESVGFEKQVLFASTYAPLIPKTWEKLDVSFCRMLYSRLLMAANDMSYPIAAGSVNKSRPTGFEDLYGSGWSFTAS
jgi:hypothetical protein